MEMSYSREQYVKLSERFNSNSFSGKLILIKNNPDIFKLEFDGDNFWLRLCDNEAMKREDDMLFNFPQILSWEDMRDLLKLIDIKLYK